ncbi:DNA topoisomerase medium subunit [Klebsiella phage CPRSA]|nr:DNA topoisomerase medium subunit [Klebsiella phage CPRSA]
MKNSNPNINVIFEGKLYSYERPETLLKDFVDIRMNVYQQRINKRIQETKEALDKALAKVAFIAQMVESPDSLRGLSRSEAVKFVSMWIGCENHAEMLVAMNIYHLNHGRKKKAGRRSRRIAQTIEILGRNNPKIEYLNDLKELSKKLK